MPAAAGRGPGTGRATRCSRSRSGTGGPPYRLGAHVRAKLPELRETEARVAQVILDQGADLVGLSVCDVAALAGTAPSSVVRACQRLGFRGYQELKIAAARQGPTRAPAPDPRDDPAARALADTIHASREALDDLATTLTADRPLAAAAAPRVVVTAGGLSADVTADHSY
ncbi:MurR/RpiR family transcriptional regulator [Streptomyces sp. NPDC057963]|uniref:MurR/RpiR family transcriptional regulator n=1 Tax=Streptomyces sp. NPDC057963 TaxID=3346290 RepID=UPI0036EA7FE8